MEQTFRLFNILTTLSRGENNQCYIVSGTFGGKYLTGMVTRIPPYEPLNLIEYSLLHQSKNYQNHFEKCSGMWPLGHVGHVTYSSINMLLISIGIFMISSLKNVSVGTTTNAAFAVTVESSIMNITRTITWVWTSPSPAGSQYSWNRAIFFQQQYDFFIQNASYILTSKSQATYEGCHINIFLCNEYNFK